MGMEEKDWEEEEEVKGRGRGGWEGILRRNIEEQIRRREEYSI